MSTNERPAVRHVCVLAVARTGSNYLMRLLSRCPEFNVKGELFHKRWVGAFSEDDLAALRRQSDGAIRDDATHCKWRATHVTETLETLYASGGARPVVFKLFPGHLPNERVVEAIFSRDDVAYIVLRRRPIESFISAVKAKAVGKHIRIDTTAIKPVLTVSHFLEWSERVRDWYAWIDAEIAVRDLPYAELSFEENLELGSDGEVPSAVLAALGRLGLPAPATPPTIWTRERQDREMRYQERVANWAEFEAEMKADPNHAAILAWAEIVP